MKFLKPLAVIVASLIFLCACNLNSTSTTTAQGKNYAIGSSGNELYIFNKKGESLVAQNDSNNKLVSAVWNDSSGKTVLIFFGSNGLPDMAVSNGNIFLFAKYTQTTVDIAIVSPSGNPQIYRSLKLDTTAYHTLTALQKTGVAHFLKRSRSSITT